MTDREDLIRKMAVRAAHGEDTSKCPDPKEPTESEDLWLQSIEMFQNGRQCAGWDLFEKADALHESRSWSGTAQNGG